MSNELTAEITGPPESKQAQRKLGITSYKPPEGSVKLVCHRCRKKFWVGPTQQAAIAAIDAGNPPAPPLPPATKYRLTCFVCAKGFMLKMPTFGIVHGGGKGGTYQYGPDPTQN